MLKFLLSLATARLASRLSEDVEDRLYRAADSVKKASIGLVIVQTGAPFLIVGFIFWLVAIFLNLSQIDRFVLPAFVSGLISLLFGGVIVFAGFRAMKQG